MRTQINALILRGVALSRGLLVESGEVAQKDFRVRLKADLQARDRRFKEKGQPKPKGRIDDRVTAEMPTYVRGMRTDYEQWYSAALRVVRQLLSERVDDFCDLYKPAKRKDIDIETYGICDYLQGIQITTMNSFSFEREPAFDVYSITGKRLGRQINILRAAREMLDSRLTDIEGVVQAQLFDSELESAGELLANGFLRPAGVVAGVVLERHLAGVAHAHNVRVSKKKPMMSDYNNALKKDGILSVPQWRKIQYLADIRNHSAHDLGREPTKEEIRELIDAVNRIVKTIH
jgi:hypothetical protein